MPCDIAASLRGGCRAVFGLKFFNTIFSSTLWTAFLITVIIVAILVIVVPVESNTPTWILFKFMFYTFMSSISVLFLHNNIVKIGEEEIKDSAESEELIERISGGDQPAETDKVEVLPVVNDDERLFKHYGV